MGYDPRRIGDCREWLTERLGPLAYFAEGEVEPAADQHVEPVEVEIAAEPEREPAPAVAARHCEWFTDTTGDVFRKCGEPIADGMELCPRHRALRARLRSGPWPVARNEFLHPDEPVAAEPPAEMTVNEFVLKYGAVFPRSSDSPRVSPYAAFTRNMLVINHLRCFRGPPPPGPPPPPPGPMLAAVLNTPAVARAREEDCVRLLRLLKPLWSRLPGWVIALMPTSPIRHRYAPARARRCRRYAGPAVFEQPPRPRR